MATIEELKKQLEEIKAKASLPAMGSEELERAALRAEITKAKAKLEANLRQAREMREDEIFEELTAKHADAVIHRIDTESGGMIVMRTPSIAKSRHFQQIALKGKLSVDTIEDFVKPCILHPLDEELEARLEAFPLLAATLCAIAQEVGSDEAKRREKKS
jgi:hypothetical protein